MERTANGGFTLLELLVAMLIISVLSGIALTQFIGYRVRAFDLLAETDLRNGITAQEVLFTDLGDYASCANRVACEAVLPGYEANSSVEISFTVNPGDHLIGTSAHPLGSVTWNFDNTDGNIVAQ